MVFDTSVCRFIISSILFIITTRLEMRKGVEDFMEHSLEDFLLAITIQWAQKKVSKQIFSISNMILLRRFLFISFQIFAGWTPQSFTSSRKNRAEVKQQNILNFLDEDEKAVCSFSPLGGISLNVLTRLMGAMGPPPLYLCWVFPRAISVLSMLFSTGPIITNFPVHIDSNIGLGKLVILEVESTIHASRSSLHILSKQLMSYHSVSDLDEIKRTCMALQAFNLESCFCLFKRKSITVPFMVLLWHLKYMMLLC